MTVPSPAPALPRRALLVAAGLTGLAACSEPAAPESPAAAPRLVDFTYGDISVQVPRDPRRVVAVEGRGDLEFALLAGYPVVATGPGPEPVDGLPGQQFAGLLDPAVVTPVMTTEEVPNLEQLAALQPDLIVVRANAWRRDHYGNEKLAAIAPVLPVEVNDPDFRTDLTEQMTRLGRLDAVTDELAAYDEAVAAARTLVAGRGTPAVAMVTTTMVDTGSIRLWTNQFGTGVAAGLGLRVLGLDPADEDGELSLSLEQLDTLATADLVVNQNDDAEELDGVGVWTSLPAVAAGRVLAYPRSFTNGSVITARAVVDLLASALT